MILFASGKYNVEENRKFYAFENAKRRSPGSDPSIKALTKIDSHRRMERNANNDKLCGYIIIFSGTRHIFILHIYTMIQKNGDLLCELPKKDRIFYTKTIDNIFWCAYYHFNLCLDQSNYLVKLFKSWEDFENKMT